MIGQSRDVGSRSVSTRCQHGISEGAKASGMVEASLWVGWNGFGLEGLLTFSVGFGPWSVFGLTKVLSRSDDILSAINGVVLSRKSLCDPAD